jgi:hypothetical protein
MGDNLETEADPASPPPGTTSNKVEITVGGHSVSVESADPLVDVVGYALGIYDQTAAATRYVPMGFDVTGGSFERAEPYAEPTLERWEADDAGRMAGQQTPGSTTRRLVHPDTPGGNRTRLRPMPVDREQRPLP